MEPICHRDTNVFTGIISLVVNMVIPGLGTDIAGVIPWYPIMWVWGTLEFGLVFVSGLGWPVAVIHSVLMIISAVQKDAQNKALGQSVAPSSMGHPPAHFAPVAVTQPMYPGTAPPSAPGSEASAGAPAPFNPYA